MIPLVILLSLLFYKEFREAIDQRVLLQLTSIKQLKRVLITEYLETQLAEVELATKGVSQAISGLLTEKQSLQLWVDSSITPVPDMVITTLQQKPDGIHDLSRETGRVILAFKASDPSGSIIIWCRAINKIQDILLERTGMGKTGETYLVGADSLLRSRSRFFPDQNPLTISAPTEGVRNAMANTESTGIFPDYRDIPVYSSYGPLKVSGLSWTILSEIDEQEALAPLEKMRRRLLFIFLLVLGISVFISLLLSRQLTKPVLRMEALLTEMAKGNFRISVETNSQSDEIESMFSALRHLVESINQAMDFARDIGQMKLDQEFEPLSKEDVLGKSLIQMRDQLKAFNLKEEQLRIATERALLDGQEREQARLSRELHDGLGPLLTSLKLLVQRVEMQEVSKSKLKSLLDETISEVRRMTYNLMPQSLLDFGVGHTLARWIELMQKATNTKIHYTNDMKVESTLPVGINVGLYRIAQEALSNAIKHAKATEIKLSLTEFDDKVSFYLQDDGIGFDPGTVSSGIGLVNMKERCRILNGTFRLTSGNDGTQIEVEIPIQDAQDNRS